MAHNTVLFDDTNRNHLLPLTFTRPVAGLRVGILTIREKWERHLPAQYSFKTEDYLRHKFPIRLESENLYINGSACPNAGLLAAIKQLKPGQSLKKGELLLAALLKDEEFDEEKAHQNAEEFTPEVNLITRPYHIFSLNAAELEADFELITEGRKSAKISSTNQVLGDRIFAEEGTKAECSILNATTGPIYLGKNSEVMEGSVVRGGLALCDNSVLKLSAKIYGATTVGPHCKVGGEVNNSVFQAYSNKGHDGFLGNAVIGEWCNLGADTNNSNLKNNYDEIKIWNYVKNGFIKTGLTFCGLIMGDHSKSGINTMFNSGTVVGVSANVFGSGFPRNYIPSFSWGGAAGFTQYKLNKAQETAERMMQRRNVPLDQVERDILQHIFDNSTASR